MIHSSSVKYVIISPEEQHSSSCLYSALSSVNVCVFVFSAALKSRSLFYTHTHTHTVHKQRPLILCCGIKKSHHHSLFYFTFHI